MPRNIQSGAARAFILNLKQRNHTYITPNGATGTALLSVSSHTRDNHSARGATGRTAHTHEPYAAHPCLPCLPLARWRRMAEWQPHTLCKSTSARISFGVEVSRSRLQKTSERMHRITCCMKLRRLINWQICHRLMLATTDSLIHMLSFSIGMSQPTCDMIQRTVRVLW